jgi:hypothetical protein
LNYQKPTTTHQWQRGYASFAFLYVFDDLKLNVNNAFGYLATWII